MFDYIEGSTMRNGMLWFDNRDDCDLQEKLDRAVQHYARQHGQRPTVCVVHPIMMVGLTVEVKGLRLRTSNDVLPNHFWLGVDPKGELTAA
jgi:hypothetical protein